MLCCALYHRDADPLHASELGSRFSSFGWQQPQLISQLQLHEKTWATTIQVSHSQISNPQKLISAVQLVSGLAQQWEAQAEDWRVGEKEKPGHFSWTHFAAGQQLCLHSSSFPGKSLPPPQLLLGDLSFCSLTTHPIPIALQQRGGNSFLMFPIFALLHNPLLYFSTLPPSV